MELTTLYKLFASSSEAQWIVRWDNAQELYNFVRENPVKKVLDLGTGIGCSPAIIALAFQDKGETNYEIHTVEQTQKCYDLAQKLIPEELKKNMRFYPRRL